MARPYRGRRRSGCLIPTLCILCVLAALVLFFINRNLVYTPEGMALRLPFTDRTLVLGGLAPTQPEEPEEQEDVNLIIEEPEQPEEPEVPDVPELTPYQQRIESSVFVPIATVLNEAAFDGVLEKLKGTGINTVVLEVKDERGRLAFVSAQEAAVSYGSNAASNTAIKNALTKLDMNGLNAAAQMSCFRDNSATRARRAWAVGTKDALVWLDPQENRWLNPFVAEACGYLTGLMGELYDLGFKEIILTNVSFPTNGIQSIISYGGNTDKVGAINAFIASAKQVAGAKGGEIGAVYNNTPATQTEQNPGGQDLAAFVGNFYRIYASATLSEQGRGVDMALMDKMAQAIGEGWEPRFVVRLSVDASADAAELADVIYTAGSRGNGRMYVNDQGIYPDSVYK